LRSADEEGKGMVVVVVASFPSARAEDKSIAQVEQGMPTVVPPATKMEPPAVEALTFEVVRPASKSLPSSLEVVVVTTPLESTEAASALPPPRSAGGMEIAAPEARRDSTSLSKGRTHKKPP
jgi:hypothetical protein